MSKESFVVSCIRRLREYGEGIILADQCISTIKDIVKSNVYTIIGMSQSGQKDRREMISVLGLNSDQAQMVNFLDVGQGIIRLAGRYPYPQLIKFPLVTPNNISESELDKINANDPRVRNLLAGIKHADDHQPTDRSTINLSHNPTSKEPEPNQNKSLERAKDLLRDIFNRFDIAATARATDFGLSASVADKLFKYIEREQYVDVVKLNLVGGRGGTSKFYSLTNPKGYETISKTPPKTPGGTGATHFFIQRYLQRHLTRKGFSDLTIEKKIGGKCIDLFGVYEGLKVGIEVCVSTFQTEHNNVRKDHDKCDFIVIVTPDKKTKMRLDQELYKKIKPSHNLTTCVVHEILNHPEKIILKKEGCHDDIST